MFTKPTDAIILLYPPQNQTVKELRQSVVDFCSTHDLVIANVIILDDEYDYMSMRLFVQAISYHISPVALVTNKNILRPIMPLILWSILCIMNSKEVVELTCNLLCKVQEESDTLVCQYNTNSFYMLTCKEVKYLADWMAKMHYTIERLKRT